MGMRLVIASVVAGTASLIGGTVVPMMFPQIEPRVGYALLGLCAVMYVVALILWIWPAPKPKPPSAKAIRAALARLYRERDRFTIREAGCLLAGVPFADFERSDLAQSRANDLLYYVQRGMIRRAGVPKAVEDARRAVARFNGAVTPITLDAYIGKVDLARYADKHVRKWLEVLSK